MVVTIPSSVSVPTTWSSPVQVPVSLVSTISTSLFITISSQPSIVIIDYTNVPSSVPTTIIATVQLSNTFSIPTSVSIPETWTAPAVIPISYATSIPSTNYITITS